MISFPSLSQTELELLAARIAEACAPRDVIALYGDLGAGKTVFSRAFIRSLGSPDEDVPSPTFTLVQTYDGEKKDGTPLTVWHFDLYRIKSAEEIYELGFEDALSDGVCLIEWPERAERLLPKNRLEIAVRAAENANARRIDITPCGKTWENRLDRIKK